MKRHYFDAPGKIIFRAGLALYLIWLLTLALPVTPVFHLLTAFAATESAEVMFLVSGALVTLNTLRAIPLYISCFCLGEVIGRYGRLLPFIAIPVSYYAHGRLTGDPGHYLGMASIMGLLIILCLQLLIWNVRGVFNRMLALSMFLFSFQWLNLAPALTPHGFGVGEFSWSIKCLAELFGMTTVLNMLALGGFSIAFAGALLATMLLVNLNRNARQFRRLTEQRAQLAVLREESFQARMAMEIQTLVHDLRRPLTSIMGMADVLESISTSSEARECAKCAGAAASAMNTMIAEIMSADSRSLIRAEELLDYVMGQISPMPWRPFIRKESGKAVLFRGNTIRISRALVNMIDNAARAVSGTASPQVTVRYATDEGYITFSVSDNGPGLPQDFAPGTSGHGSTGFGLIVAQKVAENHNGSFMLHNKPDGGAEARLRLPLAGVTPERRGEEP
jgi:signal transduction histidine kinase